MILTRQNLIVYFIGVLITLILLMISSNSNRNNTEFTITDAIATILVVALWPILYGWIIISLLMKNIKKRGK